MNSTIIDPYDYFPKGHPIKVAVRDVGRKWFLCYSKLLALEWHITDDPSIPYGATDGRRLILNTNGIAEMAAGSQGIDALVFLLCHEALHALLGHPWRGTKLRNKQVANIAADYIVNAMIDAQNLPTIPNIYLDHKVSGDLSLEQLYRKLLNDEPPPETNPTGSDLIEMELGDGEDEQEVIDKLSESNEAMMIADAAHAKKTGKTSTMCVDRGTTKDIRWQDILREYFCEKTNNRWVSPVNRPVFGSTKMVCLGRAKPKSGTLVVAIDTSGSVSQQMLSDFLSEVEAIIEQTNPIETHVISASHRVCEHVVVERGESVPTTLKGGGGTMFQPTFDYLVSQGIEPSAVIYLTDGYASDATRLRPLLFPVLWVSTGATNMNQGIVIPV
jgi:predicted metal-dependent peptidase